MKKEQAGFTLIELIVVISILGILSAIALPKFAALQTDARIAKMNSALGSIKAAAVMAHSIQLTQNLAAGTSVTMEGTTITMGNGYPLASLASIGAASGISDSATPSVIYPEYHFVSAGAGVLTIASDAGHPSCAITYTVPATLGASPTYSSGSVNTANC